MLTSCVPSPQHQHFANIMEPLDEYTALQKYISTYKDPKAAADSPENQQKDAADATKSKKWWQVSSRTKPVDRIMY